MRGPQALFAVGGVVLDVQADELVVLAAPFDLQQRVHEPPAFGGGEGADVLTRVRHAPLPRVVVPAVRQGLPAELFAGAEGVDGGACRLQRGGVGAVVVDDAEPGAVGAAHQVQGGGRRR
ncbi:hypothetical protein GCM10020256_50170 [Streptomyces thermocoprophilus]